MKGYFWEKFIELGQTEGKKQPTERLHTPQLRFKGKFYGWGWWGMGATQNFITDFENSVLRPVKTLKFW